MDEVVAAVVLGGGQSNGPEESPGKNRTVQWVQMPGVQGAGRFVPATDAAELRQLDHEQSSKSDESYEAWMRRTCAAAASIEVNINTGACVEALGSAASVYAFRAGVPSESCQRSSSVSTGVAHDPSREVASCILACPQHMRRQLPLYSTLGQIDLTLTLTPNALASR
jgi:hypothetical protein